MPLTNPSLVHQIGGNTAGATALISGPTTYLLAGGNNVTLSQNSNSVTISAFNQSVQTQMTGLTAGMSTEGNTSGTTGLVSNRLVLVGGDNVTLSQSVNGGSATLTISAGAGGGGLTNIRFSAGTTSNLLSAVTFADGNNVSFGIDASTMTASVATSLTNIRVSAGTTSNLLSAITFSNANGVSFGIDASTVTASTAGATHSYFFNLPYISGIAAAPSLSVWSVQPVTIPYTLSASFMRIVVSNSFGGSLANVGTANNVTRGMTLSNTVDVVVYTRGEGANSLSLQYYTSKQATMLQQATIQAGGTGSHWTSGHSITYPMSGVYSNTNSQAGATSASFTMHTSQFSNFSALRFFDIPFAMSLTPGAYWFGIRSSSSLSTSGTANMSVLRLLGSNLFNQEGPGGLVKIKEFGSTAATLGRIGLGVWSTNSITSTSSIAFSDMSVWGVAAANYEALPFQLVRLT